MRSASPCSARSPPTRPRACLAAHHGLTSSLISGYQLAFIIGAATIAVGIVLAFALLRPRDAQPERETADNDSVLLNLDMEQQAA